MQEPALAERVSMCPQICMHYFSVICPSVSPTSHSESHCPDHAHLISSLPGKRPLHSCCPTLPPPPPFLFFTTGPSLPTYLWRSQPMSGECMVSKHQWGHFFICIKLLGTVCRVALSVSPGLREESNSPERERERGQRESKSERRGLPVFNPNPTLQESGGLTQLQACFSSFSYRPAGPLRLMWVSLCFSSLSLCPEASPFQPGWRTHTPKSQGTFCPTSASPKTPACHLSRLRRTWTSMASTVSRRKRWMDGWPEGADGWSAAEWRMGVGG